MKQTELSFLKSLNACGDAIDWCKKQDSLESAWQACERGDWMAWQIFRIAKHGSKHHRRVVLAVCQCVRLALPHLPPDEKRPLELIVTIESWARGVEGVTLADVEKAAEAFYPTCAAKAAAAYAAEVALYADYAAEVADAAACAAADAAADAARVALYAADAAADAADASVNACTKTLEKCANIIREYFPKFPREERIDDADETTTGR